MMKFRSADLYHFIILSQRQGFSLQARQGFSCMIADIFTMYKIISLKLDHEILWWLRNDYLNTLSNLWAGAQNFYKFGPENNGKNILTSIKSFQDYHNHWHILYKDTAKLPENPIAMNWAKRNWEDMLQTLSPDMRNRLDKMESLRQEINGLIASHRDAAQMNTLVFYNEIEKLSEEFAILVGGKDKPPPSYETIFRNCRKLIENKEPNS